jgi:hypothetical protein
MPHRVWAIILLGLGVSIFAMARQIAKWKTRAWAKFYAQHPGAAERNPLSKHAGSDRSVRLGGWHTFNAKETSWVAYPLRFLQRVGLSALSRRADPPPYPK